jgi:hypothetical protein
MAESDTLRRTAELARTRPFYLAGLLLDHADREGLDDSRLADWLGCTVAVLSAVLLCRRPSGAGPEFRRDVERIASRFGLDPLRLAEAIRFAEALNATAHVHEEDWLAAARDKEPDSPADAEP